MRSKAAQTATYLFTVSVLIGITFMSLIYASPFARSWDEVDFALALDRYDLLAMQPHFPGYPYFILGGMAAHKWVSDPIRALCLFNTFMALSSVVPITLIVRRFTDTGKALLFAAVALSSPLIWVMSAQPMSEAAGIAVLWWFLWSVGQALDDSASKWSQIGPPFFFSLLMGIRLSFFPFGLALAVLWRVQVRQSSAGKRWIVLARHAAIACLFQLIWVAGLVGSEGSIPGFFKLAFAFVKGHFTDWGGGAIAVSRTMPLGERAIHLFGNNLVWHALLNRSIRAAFVLILFMALLLAGWLYAKKLNPRIELLASTNRRFIYLTAGCIGLYTLWVFIGQNIEKPRHISPVVGPILLLIYLSSVRLVQAVRIARRPDRKLVIISVLLRVLPIALILVQFAGGAELLKRQVKEAPSVYKLHRYLSDSDEPFMVYTWEETRILQYLKADYEHKRIRTFDLFRQEAAANSNKRVLLTDHVLEGFEQQAGSLQNHVKIIVQFKSDEIFDPVYHDITLYEWIP